MERKLTFHIPGLVHLPCSKEYMCCAFTQKILNLIKMLKSLGHTVYFYGAEGSDVPADEFIQTHTLKDIRKEWGEGDNRFEIGYDWKVKNFKHDFNKTKTQTTLKFYKTCIEEITKRKQPDHFILLPQGIYHKPIADAVKLYLTCEPGIGYRGSYAPFRAFEGHYIQNFTYGSEHPRQSINGAYYDRVIPNYFDLKDFKFSAKKDDYFLFIGRLIQRKGLRTAHLISKELGIPLKIAGQGMKSWEKGKLVTEEVTLEGEHLDYVGYVGVDERKKLLSKAKAVIVATTYLEPFGGTNVEAQLSGTPVLTTNFGAFFDTVEQGKTGFRCDTLDDFIQNAKKVDSLDYKYIRDRAIEKYSMDSVKYEFDKWFRDLYQLYLSTTDKNIKGWHYISK